MEEEKVKDYTIPNSADSRDLSNVTPDLPVKNENQPLGSTRDVSPKTAMMVKWVLKYSGGLIKSEEQAGYVLAFFSMIIILASLILLFTTFKTRKSESLPPEVLEQMKQIHTDSSQGAPNVNMLQQMNR